MNETFYKIRKAFIVPLFFIMVLLFLLFVISAINGQRWEIIVAAVLFFASSLACMDLVKRKIVVSEQGLKIKNIFRSKEFGWLDITHLAVVVLKKKVYFLLTTTKGFYIFSNLFENHALLAGSLMDRLGEEKVEVEVKRYLEQPVERFSLIVMSWVAVAIITGVIILKVSEIYM